MEELKNIHSDIHIITILRCADDYHAELQELTSGVKLLKSENSSKNLVSKIVKNVFNIHYFHFNVKMNFCYHPQLIFSSVPKEEDDNIELTLMKVLKIFSVIFHCTIDISCYCDIGFGKKRHLTYRAAKT